MTTKVEEMFEILAEHGVHAKAVKDSMRAFKDKYPHINKLTILYCYINALKSINELGKTAFMKKDQKFPCPFDRIDSGKTYKCRKGKTCKSICMGMAY